MGFAAEQDRRQPLFLDRFIDGGWVLAIRPRVSESELFLGHTDRPFKLIRNPWRYWCADPFLVDYLGKFQGAFQNIHIHLCMVM